VKTVYSPVTVARMFLKAGFRVDSGAFSRVAAAGTLTVRVTVTNSGERAGQEVAQLYVRDAKASVERPEKELKGFVKVALEPGETKVAELNLNMRALAVL